MNPYLPTSLGGAGVGLLASALIDPTDSEEERKKRTPWKRGLRTLAYMLGGAGLGAGVTGLHNRYRGRSSFDVPDLGFDKENPIATDVHVNTPSRMDDRQLNTAKAELDTFKKTHDTKDLAKTNKLLSDNLKAGDPDVSFNDTKGRRRKVIITTGGKPLGEPITRSGVPLPNTNGAQAEIKLVNEDGSNVPWDLPFGKDTPWHLRVYPGRAVKYTSKIPTKDDLKQIAAESAAKAKAQAEEKAKSDAFWKNQQALMAPTPENILETMEEWSGFGINNPNNDEFIDRFTRRSKMPSRLRELSLEDAKKVRGAARDAFYKDMANGNKNSVYFLTWTMAEDASARPFEMMGYGKQAAKFLSSDLPKDVEIEDWLVTHGKSSNKGSARNIVDSALDGYNETVDRLRGAQISGNQSAIDLATSELEKQKASVMVAFRGLDKDIAVEELRDKFYGARRFPGLFDDLDYTGNIDQNARLPVTTDQMVELFGFSPEEMRKRGLMLPATTREVWKDSDANERVMPFEKLLNSDEALEFINGLGPSTAKRRSAENVKALLGKYGAEQIGIEDALKRAYEVANASKGQPDALHDRYMSDLRKKMYAATGIDVLGKDGSDIVFDRTGGTEANGGFKRPTKAKIRDIAEFIGVDPADLARANGFNDVNTEIPVGSSIVALTHRDPGREYTSEDDRAFRDLLSKTAYPSRKGSIVQDDIAEMYDKLDKVPAVELEKIYKNISKLLPDREGMYTGVYRDAFKQYFLARLEGKIPEPVNARSRVKVTENVPERVNAEKLQALFERDRDAMFDQQVAKLEANLKYIAALERLAKLNGPQFAGK